MAGCRHMIRQSLRTMELAPVLRLRLYNLASLLQAVQSCPAHEMIVDAVRLAGARRSSGVCSQARADAAMARLCDRGSPPCAARSGNHEKNRRLRLSHLLCTKDGWAVL